MSYLVEVTNIGAKAPRFLFSYDNEFDIYEDKLGLVGIGDPNQVSQKVKAVFKVTMISEAEFSVSSDKLTTRKFKNYAELTNFDRRINIFYISEQAQLYTNLSKLDFLETKYFSLSCPKLNLNLKLPKNTKISLGSSEFDSIVLRQKGIKPRHVEISLAEILTDCEFKACLGQIELCNQNGAKSFCVNTGNAEILEFSLSSCMP